MPSTNDVLRRQVPVLTPDTVHVVDVCEVDNENSVVVPEGAKGVFMSITNTAPDTIDAFVRTATSGTPGLGIELIRTSPGLYFGLHGVEALFHQGEGAAGETSDIHFTFTF